MEEKVLFKGLKIVSSLLTVIFIALSYGVAPVAWAGSVGMAIASLVLLLVPAEL